VEGECGANGEKINSYRLFEGKPEEKRPIGKPRRRWADKIKMHLAKIGWDVVDWIGVAQHRYRWRALMNAE
jgi:hypothetical protein